jgi:hypothetical protein
MTSMQFDGGEIDIEAMIGATPIAMSVNEDRTRITIEMADGTAYHLDAEGDCCSNSWFENISGEHEFIGTVIVRIENVKASMPATVVEQDDKYIKFYGVKLHTTGGFLFIEYRNSSNGSYGGSLSVMQYDSIEAANAATEEGY